MLSKNHCHGAIGLYRDVWIAAIASSRKSLATQTAAICVRFQGRRVRHVVTDIHLSIYDYDIKLETTKIKHAFDKVWYWKLG